MGALSFKIWTKVAWLIGDNVEKGSPSLWFLLSTTVYWQTALYLGHHRRLMLSQIGPSPEGELNAAAGCELLDLKRHSPDAKAFVSRCKIHQPKYPVWDWHCTGLLGDIDFTFQIPQGHRWKPIVWLQINKMYITSCSCCFVGKLWESKIRIRPTPQQMGLVLLQGDLLIMLLRAKTSATVAHA